MDWMPDIYKICLGAVMMTAGFYCICLVWVHRAWYQPFKSLFWLFLGMMFLFGGEGLLIMALVIK